MKRTKSRARLLLSRQMERGFNVAAKYSSYDHFANNDIQLWPILACSCIWLKSELMDPWDTAFTWSNPCRSEPEMR